jgi:hypothetical protein
MFCKNLIWLKPKLICFFKLGPSRINNLNRDYSLKYISNYPIKIAAPFIEVITFFIRENHTPKPNSNGVFFAKTSFNHINTHLKNTATNAVYPPFLPKNPQLDSHNDCNNVLELFMWFLQDHKYSLILLMLLTLIPFHNWPQLYLSFQL